MRKACVEVMMPVSCCSTPEHRRLLLANILAKHLNDDSKWVRISAFQILGPFISTFAKQFVEVIYNKNGELVYTSKQDKIYRRYSDVLSHYHCNSNSCRSKLYAMFLQHTLLVRRNLSYERRDQKSNTRYGR